VYLVKEFIPTANNPVLRMNVLKVVVKIVDALGNDLFVFDFFLSFKLSLLNSLLPQEGGGEIITKREPSGDPVRPGSPKIPPSSPVGLEPPPVNSITHWSKVERQQLPAGSSKTIRGLIDADISRLDTEEVTCLPSSADLFVVVCFSLCVHTHASPFHLS